MWIRDSRGDIVAEKTSKKEFVGVVVGRVDPQKLNCGPEGNHIRADISPLARAKFQFQLGAAFESAFTQDFDRVIEILESLQGKIAETGDRRNMIVSAANCKLIRFTTNVFERRVRMCTTDSHLPADLVTQKKPIPKHAVYLEDLENPDEEKKGEVCTRDQ
jgi:hypothetical protein